MKKDVTVAALLEDFIRNFVNVTDEELAAITSRFRQKKLDKNEYLLHAGHVNRDLVFVLSGCVRMYYVSGEIEISAWFTFANSIAMEIHSFISETPSICSLHAIEDSEVLILPKTVLEELYQAHPVMQEFMRKIWEKALLMVIPRFSSLQNDSAEARYLQLLQNPELMQKIPQKYLASFIGVTPTSLSRIRKNIKLN